MHAVQRDRQRGAKGVGTSKVHLAVTTCCWTHGTSSGAALRGLVSSVNDASHRLQVHFSAAMREMAQGQAHVNVGCDCGPGLRAKCKCGLSLDARKGNTVPILSSDSESDGKARSRIDANTDGPAPPWPARGFSKLSFYHLMICCSVT
jgi:hypothetical protein